MSVLNCKNQSAITTEQFNTELERGYAIGPFDRIPFEQYKISPLGVADSKYSKKKRLSPKLE